MKVTRKSLITGNESTLDLPITFDQWQRYWAREGLVQDIFPHLTPEQREFLMTGITPEEWQTYVENK